MTRTNLFLCSALVAFSFVSRSASAQLHENSKFRACMSQAKDDCDDWVNRINTGDFPRGISINTTVELADGENYYLDGIISIQGKNVTLNIDFDAQPWLKTAFRQAFPFYRVIDNPANRANWQGVKVEVLVQARMQYFVNPEQKKVWSEMTIVPLQGPTFPVDGFARKRANACATTTGRR